ncbi:MAG: MYG1 family protein [Candidatus Diapherotrites archaeon]|nr:MYG1 family protein [Candidatus Diapherotrites archaeon]
MKIISHLPPRHMDDFCAISLLLTLYPKAIVEYVHPQNVPQDYLYNKDIFLVDVGGEYNANRNNFDHHQDKDIPCSLLLIVKHFFPQIDKQNPVIQTIDVIDRFGFQEAITKNLTKPSKTINKLRKTILLIEPTPEVGYVIKELLLKKNNTYDEFMYTLYKALKQQGLTYKAERKIEEEEKIFKEKIAKLTYIKLDNFNIALSSESLSPYHSEFFAQSKVDILIEKNSMNPQHTSIIVNTMQPYKEKTIEYADKITSLFSDNIIFKHTTGFIRVIDAPVKEIINNLAKICKGKI